APTHPGAVVARGARGDIGLQADDGFDAVALGSGVEVVGTEEVAVIGDRQSLLPNPGGFCYEVLDARSAVQHRVLGVDVEVDEVVSSPGSHDPKSRSLTTGSGAVGMAVHVRRRVVGAA